MSVVMKVEKFVPEILVSRYFSQEWVSAIECLKISNDISLVRRLN